MPERRYAAYRLAAATAAVGGTFAVGGLGVAAAYYPLRHAGTDLQWLLVFALMMLESAAVHLPSEVILPVAGWLLVRDGGLGIAGVAGVTLVAAAGNTVGAALLYAAGRAGGRPLVRRYGRYLLVRERDLDSAERWLASRHGRAVFLSRCLPVVRTYFGFAAGTLRAPIGAYLVLTFAGSLVWAFAFVVIGVALGAGWAVVRTPAEVGAGVIAVGLLIAVAWVTVRQLGAPGHLGGSGRDE